MTRFERLVWLAAVLSGITIGAIAQTPATQLPEDKPPVRHVDTSKLKTYYLKSPQNQNDAAEILTGLRLMLDPVTKIYLVPGQNAIMVRTTDDQFALAQQILNDIDRPRRTYRLTYTLAESESGKAIGVQHFAMVVASGARTTVKDGSRLPILNRSGSEFTYYDIGLNFEVTATAMEGGLSLHSKVEQSSVAQDRSDAAPAPIVRQAVLEGTSVLTIGKPLVLGSLDLPGSTRHIDVEVLAEEVK